ncbi:tRNA (adenosine(37)-N6)-threonylcarbamoyltransferase complex ATPase subunit type 1 TsaE [Lacinutrix sp. MedPE-SW]|uniref:tRNA (adenosine(37)-N6)-threonylcarbamoyltransferase complex ATPase subunit type 1 TsaE n=1 Tax=Lacinutrix sp. MedPE-SW TaxID=1860087 RepID=UPI00091A1150|nr:tRNA (adenosine(37)-N6)-threonylcarbamoyltransferase complex ATPase subunit type 1 TsaE [Lacinutrix sp. MedPE-SW]OIQ23908.1 MAG: tRNA (adenosine(37)-N6)-threonylcarbamoyltransferase complex ATPase subunit type 1 TsaE [Lacinutrix sp. MedPE-SW]
MRETYTLKEIDNIAKKIIDASTSKILLFDAEMGMGKTTLINAIVKALGSNDIVSSPTFSLVNEYSTNSTPIYHFDLYRIENEEELYDFGIEDYLDKNAWVLIEWPNIVESLLHEKYNRIVITSPEANKRLLTLVNE